MIWVAHDIRDDVVDFIAHWSALTELSAQRLVTWLGLSPRKFSRWRQRYGQANEHNALVPRDYWLELWEKQVIIDFFSQYPLEGHRRLAFMLLDRNLVAVSPSSVYRVLKEAGLLYDRFVQPSRKGTGFLQPLEPHDHWHIDFSYINIAATFYYLCTVLDGCSRYVIAWDLRLSMTEADAEIVLQRGRESFPQAKPPDHQRQRQSIHRPRLQRVHPPLADLARLHLPALPAEQRKTRTLPPHLERAGHSSQNSALPGGCQKGCGRLHPPLQRRSPS